MQTFTNILVEWPKGMTGIASTYMAELAGTSLWLGYLGKGGAHEQLVARHNRRATDSGVAGYAASAAGQMIGNAVERAFDDRGVAPPRQLTLSSREPGGVRVGASR